MQLQEWMAAEGVNRTQLARLARCSAPTITVLLNTAEPWCSRSLALRLRAVTGGKWSPSDLLPPYLPGEAE